MKSACFINPASGRIKRHGSRLAESARVNGAICFELTHFGQLSKFADRCIQENVEQVFIEGGDGTVHSVLSAFLSRCSDISGLPRFGILPGGMTNQIARNIGLRHTDYEALKHSLSHKRSGQPHPLLHLKIDGADDTFGFLFSTGAVPQATEYAVTKLHGSGIGGGLAVAMTIAKGILGSRKARDEFIPPSDLALSITQDKGITEFNGPHLGTLVTTLPGLMLNIDPFWGEGPGKLRLTYASETARKLPINAAGLWMGRKKDRTKDGLESFNADHLSFRYDGPCVLDGEAVKLPENTVQIIPSVLVEFIR